MLDPRLVEFCKKINEPNPDFKMVPETFRAGIKGFLEYTNPPVGVAQVKDLQHTYTDESGHDITVPLRLYNPAPDKDLAAIVLVHGGGHVCGDIETYDYMARKLAMNCQQIVVSVNYRLAPENKYPADIDDVNSVVQNMSTILAGEKTTGVTNAVGDSAGGTILATLAGRENDPIKKQVLLYPSVDYTRSAPSIETYGHGYMLDKDVLAWFMEQYLPQNADAKALSPLFGTFTANMPETLVVTAECDALHDDGVNYVQAMQKAGAKVQHVEMPGMVHTYMFLETIVPDKCQETYDLISKFLNS